MEIHEMTGGWEEGGLEVTKEAWSLVWEVQVRKPGWCFL
jgi:hypothetical protein